MVLIAVGSLVSVQVAGQAKPVWSPLRTPDGHPDFSGTWTYAGGNRGDVPVERGGAGPRARDTDTKSLVVDPPDGRVPIRPEAEAKRDYDLAHIGDSWEFVTP